MYFFYILLFVAYVSAKSYPDRLFDLELADLYFEDFKNTYNRHYESAEENDKRFEIFKQNLIKYNTFNLENTKTSYRDGITQHSDLTYAELRGRYTGYKRIYDVPMEVFVNDGSVDVPESFDWRDQNKVSPVKDQSPCGSCWAFSTTGLLESASLVQLNASVSLSEQQLVDCVKYPSPYGGCNGGGTQDTALSYINGAGGIQSEDDYPYKGPNGTCRFDKNKTVLTVTKYQILNISNDEDIKAALVQKGPLAFAFDATPIQYNDYHQEIVDCEVQNQINHAVLLVGYGSEKGGDYWIVKNSWGKSWGGYGGYFKLKRGGNTCQFYEAGFNFAEVAKPNA